MREIRLWRPLNPVNELEAIMLDNPGLWWRSLRLNVSQGKQAILMHFHGQRAELDELRRRYVSKPPPQIERVEILKALRNDWFVYEVEKAGVGATDLSGVIYEAFGPETLVDVQKNIDGVDWRIFTFRDEAVPAFLRRVEERGQLVERVSTRKVAWYKLASQRSRMSLTDESPVSLDDRRLVQLALGMGYYDVPKKVGVDELAEKVRVPRSTLHYQLSKAERRALEYAMQNLD